MNVATTSLLIANAAATVYLWWLSYALRVPAKHRNPLHGVGCHASGFAAASLGSIIGLPAVANANTTLVAVAFALPLFAALAAAVFLFLIVKDLFDQLRWRATIRTTAAARR